MVCWCVVHGAQFLVPGFMCVIGFVVLGWLFAWLVLACLLACLCVSVHVHHVNHNDCQFLCVRECYGQWKDTLIYHFYACHWLLQHHTHTRPHPHRQGLRTSGVGHGGAKEHSHKGWGTDLCTRTSTCATPRNGLLRACSVHGGPTSIPPVTHVVSRFRWGSVVAVVPVVCVCGVCVV